MQNNIVLVDLDGTIIKYNSFPRWIIFILIRSILSLRLVLFFKVIFLSLLRKTRLHSHELYKKKLISLNIPTKWNRVFSKIILKDINTDVVKLVENYCLENNCRAVISSAAPVAYVTHLASISSFFNEDVFGSFVDNEGNLFNNIGVNKKEQVLSSIDCKVIGIFTDHYLDFSAVDDNVINVVNPKKSTLEYIKANKVNCEIFYL